MERNGNAVAISFLDTEQNIGNPLDRLGGYHRCYLGDPIHLEFVSENLASMLGYTKSELTELIGGVYTALMYPDDIPTFHDLISRLAKTGRCESVLYRLIREDGSIIRVVDTMSSIMDDNGIMRGYSVVCEAFDEQTASRSLPSDGKMAVLKISGDSRATISRIHGMAKGLLAIDSEAGNLHLMDFIAMADRDKVRVGIERAYASSSSGMETCTFVSVDGRASQCRVWVECVQKGDTLEASFFCVKAEVELDCQRESKKMLSFSKQLFSGLSEDVLEVDRLDNSVKLICRSENSCIDATLNVRMFAEDFFEMFLDRVDPADRESVKAFCLQAKTDELLSSDRPDSTKIQFALADGKGRYQSVLLSMVPISRAKLFFCLRAEAELARPNASFNDVMVRKQIDVRLFGAFSIYVDGVALRIRHEKAKELLALLIERRGAFVTTREAIELLWECEPDERTRARYRKTASRLLGELKKSGIDYILESDRGVRRIAPEHLGCDYYDYRDGLKPAMGALLPEYSWSEFIRID